MVETIKKRLPWAGIGADVLVGFPGETDRAFANTVQLLAELPLSYLHVFPSSRRPGTPAADYPDQLPPDLIKRRTAEIRAIGAEKKTAFMRQNIGHQAAVLVENQRDLSTGLLKGLTDNYLSVLIDDRDTYLNAIVAVELVDFGDDGRLRGKIGSQKRNR